MYGGGHHMLRKRQATSSLLAMRHRLLYTGISSGMCSSSTLRQVTRSGRFSRPSLSYQILNNGHARSKKVCQRSLGQASRTSFRWTYISSHCGKVRLRRTVHSNHRGHREHRGGCEARSCILSSSVSSVLSVVSRASHIILNPPISSICSWPLLPCEPGTTLLYSARIAASHFLLRSVSLKSSVIIRPRITRMPMSAPS